MQEKFKKTILIDLDGVLNTYKGDYKEGYIHPPKDGAKEFLEKLNENYNIKIFTTRNRILVSKWLVSHKLDKYVKDITNIKETCWLFVDDRALKFEGNFDETINDIDNFSSHWANKKTLFSD